MLDRIPLPEKLVFGLKIVKQTNSKTKTKNTSPTTTKHKQRNRKGQKSIPRTLKTGGKWHRIETIKF